MLFKLFSICNDGLKIVDRQFENNFDVSDNK